MADIFTPKIIFRYSSIYNKHWEDWAVADQEKNQKFPSAEKILDYMDKVKKIWSQDEVIVLNELAKATKLRWSVQSIYCYMVGNCVPLSDPLTMHPYKKLDRFIDVLIHELIHQLFMQKDNAKKMRGARKYFIEKYNRESDKTITHIPLYAVHSHIYLKFYGEERLNRDIELSKNFLDYKKAWEIVKKEGYKNILEVFR